MHITTVKLPKRQGKALKLADETSAAPTAKRYRYRPRGTRTSPLVNKAISS